jgi:surface polysaccharide O-acyltransferase-like enzyme
MSPPANTPAHARLFFADALRVVAAFLVVTAHIALGLLYYSSPEHPLSWFDWHFALAINSSARWIVAGFVMVSGAFLLNPARVEPAALFYKKALSRIGIPLLFWSAFYTAWPYLFAAANYNNAALRHLRGLTGLALGIPYYHLHFLFLIAGLYLFTPMLRTFVRHSSRPTITLTIIAILALAALNTLIDTWTHSLPNAVSRFVPFIAFFLAGHQLKDTVLSPKSLAAVWAVYFSCVLATIAATHYLVLTRNLGWGPQSEYFTDFFSPFIIATSFCVFLIFRSTFPNQPPSTPIARFITRSLAPAALGIYLVHPLLLDLLSLLTAGGGKIHWPPALQIATAAIVVFTLSYALTAILMKISLLRRTVGYR